MKKKFIYLSGPISGLDPIAVKAAFDGHAQRVMADGHAPVSPLGNGLPAEASWNEHMKADVAIMMGCDEVHMLSGWEASNGACIEHDLAVALGMKISYVEVPKPVFPGYLQKLTTALVDVRKEVVRAKGMSPNNFVNQHEAYAVILEEVDELWDEIKKNQRNYDIPAQRKEAVQCAAMVFRLLVELL